MLSLSSTASFSFNVVSCSNHAYFDSSFGDILNVVRLLSLDSVDDAQCSVAMFPDESTPPFYEDVSVVDVAKGSSNCDRRTLTTPPNVSDSHNAAEISVSTSSSRYLRPNVRCRSPSPALAANTTTATKRPFSDGPAASPVVANLHLGYVVIVKLRYYHYCFIIFLPADFFCQSAAVTFLSFLIPVFSFDIVQHAYLLADCCISFCAMISFFHVIFLLFPHHVDE